MEVLREHERLRVEVAIISFAAPPALRAYETGFGLEDAALFSDPERHAYAAFGFDRASVARVWLDPRVWLSYAKLVARGRRPAPPEEDTLQLGGDVLVGPDGRIRWIHRSTGPADRPTIAQVLAARDAPGA